MNQVWRILRLLWRDNGLLENRYSRFSSPFYGRRAVAKRKIPGFCLGKERLISHPPPSRECFLQGCRTSISLETSHIRRHSSGVANRGSVFTPPPRSLVARFSARDEEDLSSCRRALGRSQKDMSPSQVYVKAVSCIANFYNRNASFISNFLRHLSRRPHPPLEKKEEKLGVRNNEA